MKSAKTLGITPLERRYLIKAEKILAKLLPKQKVDIPGDGKYMFYMPQVMIPIDLDVWKEGERKARSPAHTSAARRDASLGLCISSAMPTASRCGVIFTISQRVGCSRLSSIQRVSVSAA